MAVPSLARSMSAVVLCAAAGCAHYVPRPIEPERTAASLESRRLSDPGLLRVLRVDDGGVTPPSEWTLQRLTIAALYFNTAIPVARADWEVARAAVIAAGARPNPTLATDIAALTHGATRSPSVLSLLLDVPLVTAGKRGIQIAEARAQAESQRLQIESAGWAVRDSVRRAALDLWTTDSAVALSRASVEGESTLVALLRRRVDAGEVSALDVGRERIALERARATMRGNATRLAAARVGLATAIGVPEESLDSVRLVLDTFSAALPASPDRTAARASAVLGRSDVRAALAAYAAAQAALQLEVARQFPNLLAGLGLHWESELQGFTITPSATLPILSRNRGRIAGADARRTAAAARFLQLQAHVLARVDHALAQYAASRRALRSADSAAIEQRTFTKRIEALVGAGEADRLALESARVAAVITEQDQLAARSDALSALGALESATQQMLIGGAWRSPSAQPDSATEDVTP